MGWAMEHRPLWFLMSFVEVGLSMFLVGGIIFFFTKSIPMTLLGGTFIHLIVGIILILNEHE